MSTRTQEIRDPETLHSRFCEACNTCDLDGLLALYEPDAVIAERTGELTVGTDAIRQHLQALLAMKPAMEIVSSRTVVAGVLALNSSQWRCQAVGPDGSSVEMECHGSELTRRQGDGSWRIAIDNPWGAAQIAP